MADMNLSVLLRLVDQFTGPLAGVRKSLDGLKRQTEGINTMRDLSRPLLAGGAAVVGGLGLATKVAADFQEGMVAVQKTTGFTDGEINKLSSQFLDLSTRIPQSAQELAKIGEVGGQLGITGVENVAAFTETVAKLSSVSEFTAETGGEAIAKLANQFQLPITQSGNMASVLNELSNVSTATAVDVADLANRMAGAGRTIGLTMPQVAGLGAVLKDLGVSNEVAGTAMSDMFLEMLKRTDEFGKVAGLSGAQFKQAMEQDAMGALTQVLNGLQQFDKFQIAEMLGDLGLGGSRSADVLLKLADATKSANGEASLLSRHISAATAAFDENTSLDKEFNTGLRAMNAQLAILKNSFVAVAIEAGNSLIPVLTPVIKNVSELGRRILAFAKENPAAMQTIVKIAAAIGGLALAAGGALAVAAALGSVGTALAGLPAAGAALSAIGAVIGSSFLPVIATVAAVVAGFLLLKKAWDEDLGGLRTKVQDFAGGIGETFNRISKVVRVALAIFRGEQLDMHTLLGIEGSGLWDSVQKVVNALEFLKGLWDGFSQGASPVIGETIAGLLDTFRELGAVVGPIITNLFGSFGGEGKGVASTAQTIGQAIAFFVVKPFQFAVGVIRFFVGWARLVITIWKGIGVALAAAAIWVMDFEQKARGALESVRAWAANLWASFKQGVLSMVNSVGAFISRIPGFFRTAFNSALAFLSGLNLAAAGRRIITSLVQGIKSGVGEAVNAIKGVAQRIRNHLPFSPAKEGPLRDIMRIRIVEPIAEAITPAPIVSRLRQVVSMVPDVLTDIPAPGLPTVAAARRSVIAPALAAAGLAATLAVTPPALAAPLAVAPALPQIAPALAAVPAPLNLPRPAPAFAAAPSPAGAGGPGPVVINYSPTITIQGGGEAARESFRAELEKHLADLERMLGRSSQREGRLTF